MRGSDFGAATAVDEFEAGDRAAFVVGGQYGGAEDAVADNARGQAFGANAFLFEPERTLVVADGGRSRCDRVADAWKDALVIAEAEIDDADKILRAERANCSLGVGEAAFD